MQVSKQAFLRKPLKGIDQPKLKFLDFYYIHPNLNGSSVDIHLIHKIILEFRDGKECHHLEAVYLALPTMASSDSMQTNLTYSLHDRGYFG